MNHPSILTAIFQVSQYQNVSVLDFVGVKDDRGGGGNWSYKMCKAAGKTSPPTNQHPAFYRPDALPVAQPAVSKHTSAKYYKCNLNGWRVISNRLCGAFFLACRLWWLPSQLTLVPDLYCLVTDVCDTWPVRCQTYGYTPVGVWHTLPLP